MKAFLNTQNPWASDNEVFQERELDISNKAFNTVNIQNILENKVQTTLDNLDLELIRAYTDHQLPVYYDVFKDINYVVLTYKPKGAIIDFICKSPSNEIDDVAIDGRFNITEANKVEFVEGVNLQGYRADVKYII